MSTDASNPVAAALENVTFAPALDAAPTAGNDDSDSSRAFLAAFINGQTGANNPQRQGLNSALLDGLDPLNVLFWNPSQNLYSPLWDVHLAQWSAQSVAGGRNLRQTDFDDILDLAKNGRVTAPGAPPSTRPGSSSTARSSAATISCKRSLRRSVGAVRLQRCRSSSGRWRRGDTLAYDQPHRFMTPGTCFAYGCDSKG